MAEYPAGCCAKAEQISGALITQDIAVFRGALPDGGRLLGLDVGSKTIGLALCDAQWSIASAAHTLARGKFSADLAQLQAFIITQQVRGLVIGLPLNLDGTASPQTQAVRSYASNLRVADLPMLLWDERWSTAAVTRTLIAADASRKRRSEVVDKMAAAYILQGAIDALVGGTQ